jgi:1,4-alpha-glucan branching enzyme
VAALDALDRADADAATAATVISAVEDLQGEKGAEPLVEPASVAERAGEVAMAESPRDQEMAVATLAQAVAETEARAGAVETQGDLGTVRFEPAGAPVLDDIPEVPVTLPDKPDPRAELSKWYLDWYRQRLTDFQQRFGRDVLGAFRRLQDQGAIEIITCAATHGFSPLFGRDSTLHAQYAVAVQTHTRHFGRAPRGVWLPECAYRPGYEDARDYRPPIEQFLHDHGLSYFFTDAHAVVGGKTAGYRRHIGLYGNIEYLEMPERPLSGLDTFHGYWLPEHPVAFYARNERAGWQVWSADMGYPGDPWYREFHKRDGNSGMSYWRITGPRCDLNDKDFYNPQMALQRVHEHSDHYVALIHDMLKGYQDANGEPGHVVVPFDTELFGHWWFEGIEWIKQVVRKMAQGSGIRRVTVGELHTETPPTHAFQLPESSWGAGGHYHVWLNPEVEWMWPIIHRCERRMEELVRMYPEPPSPWHRRALAQAARELLLLEGSDWPFLVTTGQARTYAIERFNEHVERFDGLADALMTGKPAEDLLQACESIDNLFADIDYRLFADRQEAAGVTR